MQTISDLIERLDNIATALAFDIITIEDLDAESIEQCIDTLETLVPDINEQKRDFIS